VYWRERQDRLNQFYILESHAQSKGTADHVFISFEGKSYTYAQTYEIALKYGTWLREQCGVRPKDIVAMDFQNSDTYIFIWFGLWSIGAKPAFINYNLTGKALAHCVRASTAKLVIVDPLVAGNVGDDVRQELPQVNFTILTASVEAAIHNTKPTRAPDADRTDLKIQNLAILIYTSGTTGLPKPAVVSWAKCVVSSNFTYRWMGRRKDDIFYTVWLVFSLNLQNTMASKHFYLIISPPQYLYD
jgi:acyl-CoA synthetase (AMP-forming)/AMP-acid ligase II